MDNPGMPTRRALLQRFAGGLGMLAAAELLCAQQVGANDDVGPTGHHFAPRAKRVIFLFQSGGPSQIELFDHKPLLTRLHGSELPDEVRRGQRLTGMTGSQSSLPLAASAYPFRQHGESGTWVSDALPYTSKIVDDLCVIRSMQTEAINHGPGVTFVQTGSQFPGRPSIGAWLSYGLGTENSDLPAFVVLVTKDKGGQPLVSRLWGSGFLPSKHQGVRFRSGPDPVLYLNNPAGVSAETRRRMLDTLNTLHEAQLAHGPDSLIESRIANYELAFRMQTSIPEAANFADEPEHVLDQYGPDVRSPGSFAANCLLARRLVERGVRFVQLYHPGWDHHGGVKSGIATQCRETDQPSAALVADLKRRGLLEDTLVVWGGEFGRTNYCQGKLGAGDFGRDHHPRCFTMWLAGGGVRGGTNYGESDPYSYHVADNPVHIHDLQATMLHLLGIDHERLTFKYQGRRFRLTDVHGSVVRPILA